VGSRRRQQCRLPNTGLTTNHERSTALVDMVEQVMEDDDLPIAPPQGVDTHSSAAPSIL
jgi:hypothetical protein